MTKLKLKTLNKISIADGTEHDIGQLKFDLNQFKLPKNFVVLAKDLTTKVDKEKNQLGELVETGKINLTFKAFDRALVELAIANNLSEFGSPITINVEQLDSLPIFDNYDDDEFIPITFENLNVVPKKVQKKAYVQGNMVDTWQYAELKICASNYKIGA